MLQHVIPYVAFACVCVQVEVNERDTYIISAQQHFNVHFVFVQVKKDVLEAFREAEKEQKPDPSLMFTEVYKELPVHLQKQKEQMWSHVRNYPSNYPLDKFENN